MSKRIKELIGALLLTILYFIVVSVFYDITYELNDDVMINDILSGHLIKPFAFSYYLSGQLGLVLSLFYSILPAIPWFGAFQLGVFAVVLFTILFISFNLGKNTKEKAIYAILSLIFFTAVFLRSLVLVHYTVTASAIGACGLILLFLLKGTYEKRPFWKQPALYLAIIMILLAYLIRENVGFMLIPFVCIVIFCLLIRDAFKEKDKVGQIIKNYLFLALAIMLVLLINILINRNMPASEEWKEYKKLNDIRTTVYDYVGVETDEESMAYYASKGLSEDDVYLYDSYDILLDNDHMSDKLEKLSGLKRYEQSTAQRVKDSLYQYVHRLLSSEDDPYSYVIILLYLVAFMLSVWSRNLSGIIMVFLQFAYRSAFLTYLFYKGRYPERVLTALFIMEICMLTAVIVSMIKGADIKKIVSSGYPLLCIAAFGYMILSLVTQLNTRYNEVSSVNKRDDVLYSYMEQCPDDYFFVDVFASVYRTEKVFVGYSSDKKNSLILGGWLSGHPLVEQIYEQLGIENPVEAVKAGKAYIAVGEEYSPSKEEFENWLGIQLDTVMTLEYTGTTNINIDTGEVSEEEGAGIYYIYGIAR